MPQKTTRRRFLAKVPAVAAAVSGLHVNRRTLVFAGDSGSRWKDLPRLDGVFLEDDLAREQMAVDFSGQLHQVPAAVLRPRTTEDIVKIVRFANRNGLKLAMRGQGHSQYGYSLVEGGILVDSRPLNTVALSGERTAHAQAGASWDDVTRTTLARGLTPPAMGDTMTLSVGGILSAGGVSNSSHLFGGVVDNVEELDVVTGAGELIKCSPTRDSELFELALGGMGQCGLIVGARLRLMVAPKGVVRRDLDYEDLKTFLADHRRLSTEGRVEHVGALVIPKGEGRGWQFRINIGKFCASPENVDFGDLQAGLRFKSQADPVSESYADYLQRENARNAAGAAARKNTPSRLLYIAMFVPESVSEEFLARILATPSDTAGMTRCSLYVLPTRKFTRPMFVLPEQDLALNIFLLRRVPMAEETRYTEMVAVVRGLADRAHAASGKIYPPYAPFFKRSDWKAHYGQDRWRRLAAAKGRFDPNGLLTPGVALL
jgi:FAD/FMN-containing dehydrogenase